MNKVLQGVIPAVITSFNEDGKIDENKMENVLNFLVDKVNGLFICGTYGSGPIMDNSQRQHLAELILKKTYNKIPVIVNISSICADMAIELAKHAEYAGASILSSTPPYYYRYNENEILLYYERLKKSTSLPLYAYNIPKLTGNPISFSLLKKLIDIGLSGIKDSSFDINLLNYFVKEANKKDFNIIVGSSSLFLSASALGIKAFISGLSNAFPEIEVKLFNECINNKYCEAVDTQNTIISIINVLNSSSSSIAAIYEFLRFRGIDPGLPKEPYLPIDSNEKKQIFQKLEKFKYLI